MTNPNRIILRQTDPTIPVSRAYDGTSACFDLYTTKNMHLPSNFFQGQLHKSYLIPTGLHLQLPDRHWVALIKERGSVIKTGLVLRAGVIDFGYEGEIFVAVDVHNETYLEHGDKLPFQLLIQKFEPDDTTFEITNDPIPSSKISERGDGCLGSSDK